MCGGWINGSRMWFYYPIIFYILNYAILQSVEVYRKKCLHLRIMYKNKHHFFRLPQIYEEFYHTINNADHEKDLKWWSNNHGVNMAMNWPQFEVSKWTHRNRNYFACILPCLSFLFWPLSLQNFNPRRQKSRGHPWDIFRTSFFMTTRVIVASCALYDFLYPILKFSYLFSNRYFLN